MVSFLKPIMFETSRQKHPDPGPLESINNILTFIVQTYQAIKSIIFWLIGLPPKIRAAVTSTAEWVWDVCSIAGDIISAVAWMFAVAIMGSIFLAFALWVFLKSLELMGWCCGSQNMGEPEGGAYDGSIRRNSNDRYHQGQYQQHHYQRQPEEQPWWGERKKQNQQQRPSTPLCQTQKKATDTVDYLAIYQRWKQIRTEALKRKEKMTNFPAPPKLPCSIPNCTAGQQRLRICKHGLRRLYKAAVSSGIADGKTLIQLLMAERAIWHPDRFSPCPVRTRTEIIGMATELFQVIGSIIDEERR